MFEQLGVLWVNLFWQMLAFLLLVFLLQRFAYRPIVKMLDDRANRIRESMEQAEQIRLDNQNAAKRAQEILAEAQAQTREILAQANQMSQRTIAAAQEEARQQRERMLADAHTQIEADTQRAKEELQREVGRLAIMAASRVVGRSLDTQDHYRLVDEALADVQQTRGFGRG
ncbi:MAG: F0F1 ATP synthase subunit B [Chloroflexota bacterium]|nr:F0F1 ATP synthase subunit B [Chloroflexota bacterium]